MSASVALGSGWLALALIPLGAAAGWVSRRFLRGAFRNRMRVHYVIGYSALALALLHLSLSMGAMNGADATGLRLATLALFGLAIQALIGSNLQSPGDYRRVLRRWHIGMFAAVAFLAVGHVLLNR